MSHRPNARKATATPAVPAQAVGSRPAPASAAPQYVYQQQSVSTVENVLTTILHPGVNAATYNVLNVTLASLFVIISLMLWLFDGIASRFRLHLWIFLAVCFALILSVNWFFVRFQAYDGDSEDEDNEEEEEEEEEAEGEETTAAKPAAKKVSAKSEAKAAPKKSAGKKSKGAEDDDKTQ